MTKAILITGGAGYIGSHTSFLMAQKGYKVIILDNFVHDQIFNPQWATVIKKDFSDKKTLDMIFSNYKIEAVMHFAAFIEVGKSIKNPMKFYKNNVSKTISLIESMITYGVNKFIFSSSCAIYGNPQELPITENHPKNPISPYGKNKLMIEMALEDFNQAYGLQFISLRYFNAAGSMPHYGLGEQHKPETHVIPLILTAAFEQKPFYIFGTKYQTKDGSCIRDFVHVWDIANAHWLALENLNKKNPSDCFNLGTGEGFSVKQLINTVEKICRTKIKTLTKNKRIGDPPILIADPSKAFNILKWKPLHSDLEFIIKTAYTFQIDQQRTHITQNSKILQKN